MEDHEATMPVSANRSRPNWVRKNKSIISFCVTFTIFVTISLEVTTILLNARSSANHTAEWTIWCQHTDRLRLSDQNSVTICIQEKSINIEMTRFDSNSNHDGTWFNDEEWRKIKDVSNRYLLI